MLGSPSIWFLTKRLTMTLLTTNQGDGSICVPRYRRSSFMKWLKAH